jgi:hypothetical protein
MRCDQLNIISIWWWHNTVWKYDQWFINPWFATDTTIIEDHPVKVYIIITRRWQCVLDRSCSNFLGNVEVQKQGLLWQSNDKKSLWYYLACLCIFELLGRATRSWDAGGHEVQGVSNVTSSDQGVAEARKMCGAKCNSEWRREKQCPGRSWQRGVNEQTKGYNNISNSCRFRCHWMIIWSCNWCLLVMSGDYDPLLSPSNDRWGT